MKTSVSSYSFNQYLSTGEMTQLDTIRAAAQMGFDGIEFTDLSPVKEATLEEQLAYAKELRREAEACGIEIVAYTIGANLYKSTEEENLFEVNRLKNQLKVADALGVKLMRHDVCRSEKIGDRVIGYDRMLPVIAENVREITEYAQALGIRTCSENHGIVAQDSDRIERLICAVDHDNYGLLVDVGNFACADENSCHAVSRLAPYAIHVHAKDFVIYPYGTPIEEGKKYFTSRGCNKLMGCALGDGNIPVEQCLAILSRAGYDGYVSIEFEGNLDCMTEIPKGLERLRGYIANLTK